MQEVYQASSARFVMVGLGLIVACEDMVSSDVNVAFDLLRSVDLVTIERNLSLFIKVLI